MIPEGMLAAIYALLAFVSLGTILHEVRHNPHSKLTTNLIFMLSMLFCWQVLKILYHLSASTYWKRLFDDLSLPFVGLLSLSILLFTLRFFSFDDYHTPAIILCLSTIPAVTLVVALFFRYTPFVRSAFALTAGQPAMAVVRSYGPWFWVHTVYCYLLLAVAVYIALSQYYNLPEIYKVPSRRLLLGVALAMVGNLLHLTDILDTGLDYALVFGSFTAIFLHFSCKNHRGVDFLYHAKSNILNELEEAVLILDHQGVVVGQNLTAKYMLYMANLDPEEPSYLTILERLFGDASHVEGSPKRSKGISYSFQQGERITDYNLLEKPILTRKGEEVGTIVTIADVSKNRAMIRKLEAAAGIDAMTGLLNRRTAERVQQEIDTPVHYPITVIVGDLNNLKQVNDTFGHLQGDALLRLTAEAMTACCPPGAHIARTGGDEFLILIPRYSRAQAEELVREIRAHLRSDGKHMFQTSVALGIGVKEHSDELLSRIIAQADRRMYADKKESKAPPIDLSLVSDQHLRTVIE